MNYEEYVEMVNNMTHEELMVEAYKRGWLKNG